MGYILFITGRGSTRSHASANNEDEGAGNQNWDSRVKRAIHIHIWISTEVLRIRIVLLPGRVAFPTWSRALALVYNHHYYLIH